MHFDFESSCSVPEQHLDIRKVLSTRAPPIAHLTFCIKNYSEFALQFMVLFIIACLFVAFKTKCALSWEVKEFSYDPNQ